MKKLAGIVFSAIIGVGLVSTAAMADADRGQKLFQKKLKKGCDATGAKIAGSHTQDEWEAINEAGKLQQEIEKLCPNVKGLKEDFLPDLYDFFYKYGSDSGNVPSC